MQDIEGPTPEFDIGEGIQSLVVGNEGKTILVIDRFLSNPNSLISWVTNNARFEAPTDTNYPGVVAPLTRAIAVGTLDRIHPFLTSAYGVPPDLRLICNGHYGLILTPPDQLKPMQLVPHFDNPTPFRLAMLLYLFSPPQRGTAFYRHRATGFESIDQSRLADFLPVYQTELERRITRPAVYFEESDEDFIQIARVDAVFNRLVVYPSYLLHSALVDPDILCSEPENGRLTVNIFVQAG